jgi:hypothetical protein
MNAAVKKTFDYTKDSIDGAYGEEQVRILFRAEDWVKPDYTYPTEIVDRIGSLGFLRLFRGENGGFTRFLATPNSEFFAAMDKHYKGEFLTCERMRELCLLPGWELSLQSKALAKRRKDAREANGIPESFDIRLDRANSSQEKYFERFLVKALMAKTGKTKIKVEVKNDLQPSNYGNIFAELTYKGNASGINGEEGTCGWWVYALSNPDKQIVATFGIVNSQFLRIANNWKRFSGKGAINGGQHATGVKVPAMELIRENPDPEAVKPLNFMIVEDATDLRESE